MADIFSAKKRSEIMSRIGSKNTAAELIVFAFLRKNRIYFQKHYKRAPGKPDIALPRKKIAIFIDGDFWHGRTLEEIKQKRTNPDDFWIKKITQNVERDREQERLLLNLGWKILRVWETDLKRKRTRELTLQTIARHLHDS